jgi:hypothetical protein
LPVPRPAQEAVAADLQIAALSEARVFVVGERISPEEAAELRRAVIQAAAEGRKVKFRVHRTEKTGGGGSDIFDINIQTLVKGE